MCALFTPSFACKKTVVNANKNLHFLGRTNAFQTEKAVLVERANLLLRQYRIVSQRFQRKRLSVEECFLSSGCQCSIKEPMDWDQAARKSATGQA